MGNPRKDRPTNRKNQPSKIQTSIAIGYQQDGPQPENGLSIKLKMVDYQVYVKAYIGCVVNLIRTDDIYEVHLDTLRLGNIPIGFTSIITARKVSIAVIEQLSTWHGPEVTIRVSLKYNN